MALTEKSKIKELIANPEAVTIIQKYLTKFNPADPQLKPALKMYADMSLKAICGFPQTGISKDDAEKMYAELQEANLS